MPSARILQADQEILVDQAVAHPAHFSPRDMGIACHDVFRHVARGFADHFYLENSTKRSTSLSGLASSRAEEPKSARDLTPSCSKVTRLSRSRAETISPLMAHLHGVGIHVSWFSANQITDTPIMVRAAVAKARFLTARDRAPRGFDSMTDDRGLIQSPWRNETPRRRNHRPEGT